MNYIILDFEWNQPSLHGVPVTEPFPFSSEIMEIGAVKLDADFRITKEYKAFVRPVFYPVLNPVVARLTKIRKADLEQASRFPEAYADFLAWCGPDCCFCTWGPDDIPVLMDNLLMHGQSVQDIPVSYDLQKIFCNEILLESGQCSLEHAMEILKITPDRAHDALNDARNTAAICARMNLEDYLDIYPVLYTCYASDRIGGLTEGKRFPNVGAVHTDPAFSVCDCPSCGATIPLEGWIRKSSARLFAYAPCPACSYEAIASFRIKREKDGSVTVARSVCDVNDDLWDTYMVGKEKTEGAE